MQLQRKLRLYVAGTTAIALLLTVAIFAWRPTYSESHLLPATLFGFFAFLASLKAYTTTREVDGNTAFLPVLTCVVLLPHWISVVGIACAIALAELTARRVFLKMLFNTMQGSGAAATAVVIYVVLGGSSLLEPRAFSALPYVSAILAYFAVNSLALSGITAIHEGKSIWSVWFKNLSVTLLYDVFAIPFVFVFAYTYVKFGVIGAAIFMIPVLAVRELYKTTRQLEKTNQELLELMVAAIEARDPYTSGHSRRVAEKARVISKLLGLSEKKVERIVVAALLHDVGKIYEVFGPILSKPGKLTPEENAIMRTHPLKSEELAANVSSLKDVLPLIRHHHENWDGSGYPNGLFGEAIPLGSRIIMFADTIDAMTTDRPYRAALDEKAVRRELERFRGKQFDPKMYDSLLGSSDFSRLFGDGASVATPKTPARPLLTLERQA